MIQFVIFRISKSASSGHCRAGTTASCRPDSGPTRWRWHRAGPKVQRSFKRPWRCLYGVSALARTALLVERIQNACRREGKLNAPQFSIAQRCYL
jgi:hypothetical protein